MPFDRNIIEDIVNESRSHAAELPWIEFKTNNCNPQVIGEYVSALSNTAALFNQEHGFLIWGVDDATHEITGTTFVPSEENKAIRVWNYGSLRSLNHRYSFIFIPALLTGKT